MTMTQIKSDLHHICNAFNLGKLIGYKTEKYSVQGYDIAKFETSTGNFEYIFKN